MKTYQFKDKKQRVTFEVVSLLGYFGILLAASVLHLSGYVHGSGVVAFVVIISLACFGWNALIAQTMGITIGGNK